MKQASAIADEPRDDVRHAHVVLQTQMDSQCNKLATVTVVGRIELTTL